MKKTFLGFTVMLFSAGAFAQQGKLMPRKRLTETNVVKTEKSANPVSPKSASLSVKNPSAAEKQILSTLPAASRNTQIVSERVVDGFKN